MVQSETENNQTSILLTPNRSLSWRHTRLIALLLGIFVLTIGLGWAVVGAWVILPFSILEFGLLFYFFYLVSWKTYHKQLLTITPDQVVVLSGVNAPRLEDRMQRPVQLIVERQQLSIHNLRLYLSDSRRELAIGDFLNKDDQERLVEELAAAGIEETAREWWKQR